MPKSLRLLEAFFRDIGLDFFFAHRNVFAGAMIKIALVMDVSVDKASDGSSATAVTRHKWRPGDDRVAVDAEVEIVAEVGAEVNRRGSGVGGTVGVAGVEGGARHA